MGGEVYRAIILLSPGAEMTPSYGGASLREKVIREGVFLYPVVHSSMWRSGFFDLAGRTAGLWAVFGVEPASQGARVSLDINLIQIAQDLNGKYSFSVQTPEAGRKVSLVLKCRRKGVVIRFPRKTFP